MHPHFAADMSKYLVPVVELHPEEGVWQRFDYRALNLDGPVFLGHILRASLLLIVACWLVVLLSCTAFRRKQADAAAHGADRTTAQRKQSRVASHSSTCSLTCAGTRAR